MEQKEWWKSKAIVPAAIAIALYFVSFLYLLLGKGTEIMEAAKTASEVVLMVSPVLGGVAVIGLRTAETNIKKPGA